MNKATFVSFIRERIEALNIRGPIRQAEAAQHMCAGALVLAKMVNNTSAEGTLNSMMIALSFRGITALREE